MNPKRNWQYDKFKYSGVDFSDPSQVQEHDRNHQKFRNYQRNAEAIIHALELGIEHTVIDMGAEQALLRSMLPDYVCTRLA